MARQPKRHNMRPQMNDGKYRELASSLGAGPLALAGGIVLSVLLGGQDDPPVFAGLLVVGGAAATLLGIHRLGRSGPDLPKDETLDR